MHHHHHQQQQQQQLVAPQCGKLLYNTHAYTVFFNPLYTTAGGLANSGINEATLRQACLVRTQMDDRWRVYCLGIPPSHPLTTELIKHTLAARKLNS